MKATFTAQTITGPQPVEGYEVEYGLVLHPSTDERSPGWFSVSEPRSGRSICHGPSIDACMRELRDTVRAWGGCEAFVRTVEFSVQQLLTRRRAPATANFPCGSLGEEVPA